MSIFEQICYIFGEIKAPLSFRFAYLTEKCCQYAVILINRLFGIRLLPPYLLRRDYILLNATGAWRIRGQTDDDFTVNPAFERPLEPWFVCPEGVFLDIGAHIGRWAITVAMKYPEAYVYAFEPHPGTFRSLSENINLHHLVNVTPIERGVSSSTSTAHLNLAGKNLSMTSISAGSGESGDIEIQTIRMDEWLADKGIRPEDIRLIKIDVEGGEANVFAGMEASLSHFHPDVRIICEILDQGANRDAIFATMIAHGYEKIIPLETGRDYVFMRK